MFSCSFALRFRRWAWVGCCALIVVQTPFFAHILSAQALSPKQALALIQADTVGLRGVEALQAELASILADSTLASATVGLYVSSLKTKETLFAYNENKTMTPASNMKIISTASAMDYLGANFTYTTTVFLDGILKKSSGEFVGNVIIRGSGDPSMSLAFFEDPLSILRQWCGVLDSLGVRSIRGSIVGDDSYFDDEPWGAGWAWDDMPYYYSAQISALSFYDNAIDIVVKPAYSVGQIAEARFEPQTPYITLVNSVRTVPKDSLASVSVMRQAYSNVVYLTGTIAAADSANPAAAERTLSVSVDNPALFTVSLFKKALEEQGIPVRGGIFDAKQWGEKIAYAEMRPVCYHVSPPLKDIARNINTVSNNLAAELVWRTAAKELTGKGNADKSAEMSRQFAEKNGFSLKNANLADGSGLSRMNILSPKQIAAALAAMYNSKNRTAFTRSLAVPGERGTLQNRFKGTIAEKTLKAKTGTLTGVSALSGYISTREQEPLVFSMIFNGYALPASVIRAFQEMICLRLAGFTR